MALELGGAASEASKMRSLSLCVYMATYFRFDHNVDCKLLFSEATQEEREHLLDLWEAKERDIREETASFEASYEVFDSFSTYKKVCEQSADKNSLKLDTILAFKQMFSVPWLLCSEHLLSLQYLREIN